MRKTKQQLKQELDKIEKKLGLLVKAINNIKTSLGSVKNKKRIKDEGNKINNLRKKISLL